MNTTQLHYFLVLAKLQHYGKTAEQCSISQPTLSKSIKSLENELQVSLFRKAGRNTRLTEEGKLFYEYAEKAIATLDEGIYMLTQQDHQIRIGYVSSVQFDFVPSILKSYSDTHPTAYFSSYIGTSPDLINHVLNDDLDIAFCTKMKEDPSLEYHLVMKQPLVVVMSKDHPLANRSSLTFKDLKGQRMLLHGGNSGMRTYLNRLFEVNHFQPNIAGEANEDNALIGMISTGMGIAILTDSPSLILHNTVKVPFMRYKIDRNIVMVTRKDSYRIQSFRNFILNRHTR